MILQMIFNKKMYTVILFACNLCVDEPWMKSPHHSDLNLKWWWKSGHAGAGLDYKATGPSSDP